MKKDVVLYILFPDVGRAADHVDQLQLTEVGPVGLAEHLQFLVLEPKAIGIAQTFELLLDQLGEQRPGAVDGLEHAADVDVDVVHLAFVGFGELLEYLGVGAVESRVYFSEIVDHGQVVALAHRVVVRQTVVPAPHDVQGGQISAGELHRAEQVVPDVRAQDRVLLLGQLRREPHQEFLEGLAVNFILQQ